MLQSLVTLDIVVSSVLIIAVACCAVSRSATAAGWERRRARRAVTFVALLLCTWLATAAALALQGAFTAEATRAPTIQFGVLLPIVAGVVLYRRSPFLREMIATVPQSWLIGIQFYRVVGVNFLILYAAGHLPGLFALPAGIGDIIVGAAALAIALGYRYATPPDWLVRAWNGFGIADLAVAVTAGFLTSPSPLQATAFDAPNQLITEFPLVLVPVFAVPLSILLHLASLARLKAPSRTAIAARA